MAAIICPPMAWVALPNDLGFTLQNLNMGPLYLQVQATEPTSTEGAIVLYYREKSNRLDSEQHWIMCQYHTVCTYIADTRISAL